MKNKEQSDSQPWYKKVNASKWIGIIAAIFSILGISVFNNRSLIKDNTREISSLLEQAEKYYINKEYDKMMSIYSNSKMQNNPIALLNTGVLYANGVYFSCDKEQAIFYFNRALEEGETYYSILYLLQLYSYENLDEIEKIISIGCMNNNKYCEKILQDLYKHAGINCTTSYLSDFNTKTNKEKDEIIKGMFDIVDQYKYKVATNYAYTVYNDENGDPKVTAEAIGIEERTIDTFLSDYFKIDEIQMVFSY